MLWYKLEVKLLINTQFQMRDNLNTCLCRTLQMPSKNLNEWYHMEVNVNHKWGSSVLVAQWFLDEQLKWGVLHCRCRVLARPSTYRFQGMVENQWMSAQGYSTPQKVNENRRMTCATYRPWNPGRVGSCSTKTQSWRGWPPCQLGAARKVWHIIPLTPQISLAAWNDATAEWKISTLLLKFGHCDTSISCPGIAWSGLRWSCRNQRTKSRKWGMPICSPIGWSRHG